jgi:hypothetical protein
MSPSNRRRVIATLLMCGALVGASATVGASGAAASYPSDSIHYCGSLLDPTTDDGPVTDGIHHNLEPVLGGLQPSLHQLNCNLLAGVLGL